MRLCCIQSSGNIPNSVCQDWTGGGPIETVPRSVSPASPTTTLSMTTERATSLLRRYATIGFFFDQHIENLKQGLKAERVAAE